MVFTYSLNFKRDNMDKSDKDFLKKSVAGTIGCLAWTLGIMTGIILFIFSALIISK